MRVQTHQFWSFISIHTSPNTEYSMAPRGLVQHQPNTLH